MLKISGCKIEKKTESVFLTEEPKDFFVSFLIMKVLFSVLCSVILIAVGFHFIKPNEKTITVSGFYEEYITPDLFELYFQLEFLDSTKESVSEKLESKRRALYDLIKKENIPKDSVLAHSVSLEKQWKWENNSRTENGYSIRQNISVKINSKESAENLLLKSKKINDLELISVTPIFTDFSAKETEIKSKALKKAMEKAEILAKTTNQKTGKVLRILETETGNSNASEPMLYGMHKNTARVSMDFASSENTGENSGDNFAKKIKIEASIKAIIELK